MTEFLRIGNGQLRAEISPYGAALARLWLRGHGHSMVLGLPQPEDYVHAPHAIGVVVGPIAGRVSRACMQINGREYAMEANTPPDCLHSGSEAIQHRLWQVAHHSAQRLSLRCMLPDGACGLPGERAFTAHYSVAGQALMLTIETTSDVDTLVNATSHAYWTLDDAGDLSTHRLTVDADRMLDTGPDLIPTGRILTTTGGPFDFTAPRDPLAGPPLDGCFCLPPATGDDLRPILHLTSVRSGLALTVESNQPGVVLYSGENLPRHPLPADMPPIRPFAALAVEPQAWPDAANHPDFPSIFLKGSDTIRNIMRFSFESP